MKLIECVELEKVVVEMFEEVFKEKFKGIIDVWWLFDDGGLIIFIFYLLLIYSYWKDCKLRIFIFVFIYVFKSNEFRMVNLLKRFCIDFSSVVEVEGINM